MPNKESGVDNFWADVRKRKSRLDKKIEENVADTEGDPDSIKTKARNVVAAGLGAAADAAIPESTGEAVLAVAGGAAGKLAGRAAKAARAADKVEDAGSALKRMGRTRNLDDVQKAKHSKLREKVAKRLGLDSADELPSSISKREKEAKKSFAKELRRKEAAATAKDNIDRATKKPAAPSKGNTRASGANDDAEFGTSIPKRLRRRKYDETAVGNEEVTK